jgi:hypothetical protein
MCVLFTKPTYSHTVYTTAQTCRRDRNCTVVHAACANVCYVNKTQPITEF